MPKGRNVSETESGSIMEILTELLSGITNKNSRNYQISDGTTI